MCMQYVVWGLRPRGWAPWPKIDNLSAVVELQEIEHGVYKEDIMVLTTMIFYLLQDGCIICTPQGQRLLPQATHSAAKEG